MRSFHNFIGFSIEIKLIFNASDYIHIYLIDFKVSKIKMPVGLNFWLIEIVERRVSCFFVKYADIFLLNTNSFSDYCL